MGVSGSNTDFVDKIQELKDHLQQLISTSGLTFSTKLASRGHSLVIITSKNILNLQHQMSVSFIFSPQINNELTDWREEERQWLKLSGLLSRWNHFLKDDGGIPLLDAFQGRLLDMKTALRADPGFLEGGYLGLLQCHYRRLEKMTVERVSGDLCSGCWPCEAALGKINGLINYSCDVFLLFSNWCPILLCG